MTPTQEVLEAFLLRNLPLLAVKKLNLVASPAGLPTSALAEYKETISLTSADWRSFTLAKNLALAANFAFPLADLSFNPANWPELPTQLLFWPKAKEEGYFWLEALQKAGFKEVYLAGENNAGVQAAAKNLTKLGAEVTKLDAAKRCSLFLIDLLEVDLSQASGEVKTWQLEGFTKQSLTLVSQPGVFSHGRLDEGTQLLLSCLANIKQPVSTALDLGCGYGVLAAALAKHFPEIDLTLSDVNAFALAASDKTLAANNLTANLVGADVFNGLAQAKPNKGWDLIITNPPFHAGKATSYAASETLIASAKNFLSPKGQLWLVANSFLPYESLLAKAFSNYSLVTATNKFKVYVASND